MKKKIMWGMCIVTVLSVILTALFAIIVIYEDIKVATVSEIEAEADYVKYIYENNGLNGISAFDEVVEGRITIFANGESVDVLYDSLNKGSEIDEEYRKSELANANENGTYTTSRYSASTNSNTFYAYVVTESGDVVRVSEQIQSAYSELFSFLPWMILISLFVCILAVFIAKILTHKIIAPIEKINIDKPNIKACYEELYPLLRKVERQRREIKQNIRLLEHRQKQFDTIISNMNEGFIVTDINGDILTFNQAAIKLCGYERRVENGESVFKINRNADFFSAIEQAIKGNNIIHEQKIDGRFCKFLINQVETFGEVHGVIILIMDLTETESREEMRREFTANVSHELKTPLTSISGYSEIIKAGIAKDEDVKGFAEKIYNEAQRLIELVADIIKLSRLDESNGIFKKELCDIYEIAKNATQRLALKAEKNNIDLQLIGSSVRIKGIANMIEETIYNLTDNAIKYNKEGGSVVVRVKKFADKAVISVTDNGIGIPAQERDRIFERFYRVDKSHSKETGGTGLGLSIVKHCVKLHSGTIKLNSELKKGTKIVVEL